VRPTGNILSRQETKSVSLDVSLLLAQVPYLPPDDQQTLPTTLRELRLVDGAFGNAVPLKLSHLTAVSRLVFVGNSSMPGKVFGSIGGPGAYCLVRGSALPPAVQQLEVQAVASMEPILKLQHLQVRPCIVISTVPTLDLRDRGT
jgi:hypothetical protein